MTFTDTITQKCRNNQFLLFIFFLAGTLYAPVTLIRIGVIPFHYRFVVMFLVIAAMVSYVCLRKFHLSDLGFRRDTLKRSLLWNLATSFLFLTIIYLLRDTGLADKSTIHLWPLFFVFYILILTPVQEFFFRSLLFAETANLRCQWKCSVVILSALSFCFLHVIYQRPMMMLVSFCMGFVWSIIYYKYPNFWGVTLSHALLGSAAFAFGLI